MERNPSQGLVEDFSMENALLLHLSSTSTSSTLAYLLFFFFDTGSESSMSELEGSKSSFDSRLSSIVAVVRHANNCFWLR